MGRCLSEHGMKSRSGLTEKFSLIRWVILPGLDLPDKHPPPESKAEFTSRYQ